MLNHWQRPAVAAVEQALAAAAAGERVEYRAGDGEPPSWHFASGLCIEVLPTGSLTYRWDAVEGAV